MKNQWGNYQYFVRSVFTCKSICQIIAMHTWLKRLVVFTILVTLLTCTSRANALSISSAWLGDLSPAEKLDETDLTKLGRFAWETLAVGQGARARLSPKLTQDKQLRMVFLSVSDSQTIAQVTYGFGQGFAKAIQNAAHRMTMRKQVPRSLDHLHVRVDVVTKATPKLLKSLRLPKDVASGLKGLAFDRNSQIVLLGDQWMVRSLLSKHGRIKAKALVNYLGKKDAKKMHAILTHLKAKEPQSAFVFQTQASFYDGVSPVILFRGHRVASQLSAKKLQAAATLGGQYLIRKTHPSGRFTYEYDPSSGETSNRYNALRHCGSVYAMLDLFALTGDAKLLAAAERGLKYITNHLVQPYEIRKQKVDVIVDGGAIKLGGNALAILAFTRHAALTGNRDSLRRAQQLARFINLSQSKNGQFLIHKASFPNGRVSKMVSRFYPGEAIFALMRLYQLDKNITWLETANRSAHYLILVRDKGKPTRKLHFDHWLLYGLNELYRQRPDPILLKHCVRMVYGALYVQRIEDAKWIDWVGSFITPPRCGTAATRVEGMCAAYRLLRDQGSPQIKQEVLPLLHRGILRSAQFVLQLQVNQESALFHIDPTQAMGGFKESLTSQKIRIDIVQHSICALLGTMEILNNGYVASQ